MRKLRGGKVGTDSTIGQVDRRVGTDGERGTPPPHSRNLSATSKRKKMAMEERTRSTSSPSRRSETQLVRESRGIFVAISPLHRRRSSHFIRKIFMQREKVSVSENFSMHAKNFSSDTPNRVRYANAERVARMSLAVDIAFDSRHVRKSFQSSDASTISPTCQPLHARDASRCSRCTRTVRRQPRSVHSRVS